MKNLPLVREKLAELSERALYFPGKESSAISVGLRAWLDKVLLSDELLVTTLTENISLLYAPVGGAFRPGRDAEYTVSVPLPMLKSSVQGPTTARFRLIGPDPATLRVSTMTDLPADKLMPMVADLISTTLLLGLEESKRKAVVTEVAAARFDIRLDQEFVVKDGDPWLKSLVFSNRMSTNSAGKPLELRKFV